MATLTIKVVGRGSERADGISSTAGHIWVTVTDKNGISKDYGYQPGGVTNGDSEMYPNVEYNRQIPITDAQAGMIKDFGDNSNLYGYPSNGYSIFNQNTCVQYVYDLLDNAGFDLTDIDRDYFPINNKDSFDSLSNPYSLWDFPCVDNWCKLNRDGTYYIYDPLVLDLDGDGIETIGHNKYYGAMFDLNANGIKNATGWVKGDDGILVFDRNQNGTIDTGAEVFGDATVLKNGDKAAHGFAALAEMDSNGDGKVNADDADFDKLKIWRDLNGDGVSQAGELFTLNELGIKALNLAYQDTAQGLGGGNTLAQIGSYEKTDGTNGKMGDVNFRIDTVHTQYTDRIELTLEQAQMVNLKGIGWVRDLREAAAFA